MALNKQRILSELGSVVNQLQSAECGCMGKLFSDPGQGSSMGYGGCQGGGCCHGHGSPYAGEPYSAMNNQCNMNRHCMGQCNPSKLYADTYGYLNKNLMQPVMNEVYNDLKSITPENTVMHNPTMANKMGISPTNQAGLGNMGAMSAGTPNQAGDMSRMSPGYNVAMGNANATQPLPTGQFMGHMDQPMGQMGQSMGQMSQPADLASRMGSQIVNMMMNEKSSKPINMPAQNSQPNESITTQPLHGQVGMSPMNPGSHGVNPTTQYMTQPNSFVGSAMNNTPQNVQSAQPMTTNSVYGQHALGMKKFSEMFPGVMQADLGFDPMAIAIQMNPANQQKVAMNTMQQLMNGNRHVDPNSSVMKTATNATTVGFAQVQGNQQVMPTQPLQQQQQPMQQQPTQQQPMQQQPMQQQPMQQQPMQQQPMQQQPMQQQPMQQQPMQHQPMQQQPMQHQPMQQQPMQLTPMQQQPIQQQPMQQTPMQQQQPMQQQPMHSPQQQQFLQPQEPLQNVATPNLGTNTHQVPQQQVFTAGSAVQYQQAPSNVNYQYQQQPQQYQAQQLVQHIIDPNTGAITNAPNLSGEDSFDTKRMIMEPIFPADAIKNQSVTFSHHIKHPRNKYYNTLGQPVQMLDAKVYQSSEPPLPQTLSPQPIPSGQRNNPQMYSNVKNTVSKTSIMAQGKLGATTSKSQLQHLYNQYKGSQSFTQQNVNAPIQHHTHSEGRINDAMKTSPALHAPVEKVGGDTIANNVDNINNPVMNKMEHFAVPMGDVAAVNKPQGDGAVQKIPVRRARNGLQDLVFTSSPSSAAWTFHGHNHMPYSTAYRFRSKAR